MGKSREEKEEIGGLDGMVSVWAEKRGEDNGYKR